MEKVLDIRKGKRTSRYSSHWSYPDIKRKLVALGEVEGFHLTEVDNRFRSQRCSKCGWVHKGNRKGKTFRCSNGSCGHTADADLNAASNLKLCLADVSLSPVWFDRMNRTAGFYWLVDGFCDQHGVLIVPHIPK